MRPIGARPGRDGRNKAALYSLLAAFGVDPHVSGSNTRSVEEDVRQLTARLRAYNTNAVVVRHATNLHTDALNLVLALATSEGLRLVLTCDENVGADLADWVTEHDGTVRTNLTALRDELVTHSRPGLTLPETPEDNFPLHLPQCGWFTWRARAREQLEPDDYAKVDTLYLDTARDVYANPFTSAEDAAARLQDWYQAHPYPGQMLTVVRAAEAAMFKHGLSLKADENQLLNTVENHHHRRLTATETRRLRAYYPTWRAANRVLRDSDLSMFQINELTFGDVQPDGTLPGHSVNPEGQLLLAAHWHYRDLQGAAPDAPFLNRGIAYMRTAIRQASMDLNLPSMPTFDDRKATASLRWQAAIGVSLTPLTGSNNPNRYTALTQYATPAKVLDPKVARK